MLTSMVIHRGLDGLRGRWERTSRIAGCYSLPPMRASPRLIAPLIGKRCGRRATSFGRLLPHAMTQCTSLRQVSQGCPACDRGGAAHPPSGFGGVLRPASCGRLWLLSPAIRSSRSARARDLAVVTRVGLRVCAIELVPLTTVAPFANERVHRRAGRQQPAKPGAHSIGSSRPLPHTARLP